MTHNPSFVARICLKMTPGIDPSLLRVHRDAEGSNFRPWKLEELLTTDHDRRHDLINSFLQSGEGNARDVATALRPHLEAYLRVVCPQDFGPGALIGPFLEKCRRALDTPDRILLPDEIRELGELNEYAGNFHHDTNPGGYSTATVNETELAGFAKRTLDFVGI